jgi:hypothetical protein
MITQISKAGIFEPNNLRNPSICVNLWCRQKSKNRRLEGLNDYSDGIEKISEIHKSVQIGDSDKKIRITD